MKTRIVLSFLLGVMFIGCVSQQELEQRRIAAEKAAEERRIAEEKAAEQRYIAACDKYWNGLASGINEHKTYKDREEYLQALKSQLLHDDNDGTVLLNEFASEYLPNTFAKYEKAREKSLEVEQNLNTIFIGEIDDRSPNWISYLTATEKYSKILVDELRIQNGISYIYFLHKVGALTDEKLAEFDNTEKMNFVHENYIVHSLVDNIVKKDNVIEFAQKNMPETFALLETFEKEQNLTKRMFEDIMSDAQKLNYLKINSTHIVFLLVEYKYRELTNNYNLLMQEINDYQTKYLLLEITGGELATVDGNIGARYRKFSKNLPEYVKKGVLRRNCKFSTIDSILMSMVQIPGKDYFLSKFEVTQAQWFKIMENNPSRFLGWNLPVDNVTWNDSLEFIEKLNSLPEVKKSGLVFRLPTQEEWEYAFFSDKTAKDYRDSSREEVQQTGWNWKNSGGKTHPVGQKKPNPFGLYDMYGNAGEWLDIKDQHGHVYFVVWNYKSWGIHQLTLYSTPNGEYGHFDSYEPGFRLAASRKTYVDEEEIIETMVQIPGKDYLMGKYEVTQAQWQSIMGNNPSDFKGDSSRPVEKVSWDDCQEFIKKLNSRAEVKQAGIIFRLPTEEEWEYACRAGSTGKYGLLADGREGTLNEMGWYSNNSRSKTHPVGQKTPNAWGLYDMHGNVWEWTDSGYRSNRIYRGGGWYCVAEGCEAGFRGDDSPDDRSNYLGFRLVASRTGK